MTIGEVARASGFSRSAIRFYEARGVLAPPARVSGQRRYEHAVLGDLALIRVAQAAGFSLAEIRELLAAGAAGGERLRALARARAAEVERELGRLHRVRTWLDRASGCSCEDLGDCELVTSAACAP